MRAFITSFLVLASCLTTSGLAQHEKEDSPPSRLVNPDYVKSEGVVPENDAKAQQALKSAYERVYSPLSASLAKVAGCVDLAHINHWDHAPNAEDRMDFRLKVAWTRGTDFRLRVLPDESKDNIFIPGGAERLSFKRSLLESGMRHEPFLGRPEWKEAFPNHIFRFEKSGNKARIRVWNKGEDGQSTIYDVSEGLIKRSISSAATRSFKYERLEERTYLKSITSTTWASVRPLTLAAKSRPVNVKQQDELVITKRRNVGEYVFAAEYVTKTRSEGVGKDKQSDVHDDLVRELRFVYRDIVVNDKVDQRSIDEATMRAGDALFGGATSEEKPATDASIPADFEVVSDQLEDAGTLLDGNDPMHESKKVATKSPFEFPKARVPGLHPFLMDWDNDGKKDLLLGEVGPLQRQQGAAGSFIAGKVRFYRNVGSNDAPRFNGYVYIKYGKRDIKTFVGMQSGCSVSIADIDNDGSMDFISGMYPGRVVVHYGKMDKSGQHGFAPPQVIKGLKVPSSLEGRKLLVKTPHVATCDWDGDGDIDLVAGISGPEHNVFLIANTLKKKGDRAFSAPTPLHFGDGTAIKHAYSVPCVVDWDGDGDLDLLVGGKEEGVVLYVNVGTRNEPMLDEPELLVVASVRSTKFHPFAVDWNEDGNVDLLIGQHNEVRGGMVRLCLRKNQE